MAEIRRRGLVSAVVISPPFLKLGQTQARTFGAPDLPLIVIKHPLGGISLDEVKARADQVIPKFVEIIREHMK